MTKDELKAHLNKKIDAGLQQIQVDKEMLENPAVVTSNSESVKIQGQDGVLDVPQTDLFGKDIVFTSNEGKVNIVPSEKAFEIIEGMADKEVSILPERYVENADDARPVTSNIIRGVFPNNFEEDVDYDKIVGNIAEQETIKAFRELSKNAKADRIRENLSKPDVPLYKEVEVDGKKVGIVDVQPSWLSDYENNCTSDTWANLDRLSKYITKELLRQAGGFRRLNSLVIEDEIILLNGVYYRVRFPKGYSFSNIPPCAVNNIKHCRYYDLFDWSVISRFVGLVSISIPSNCLSSSNLGNELVYMTRKYPSTLEGMFSIYHKLQKVTIGDDTVTREDLASKEKPKNPYVSRVQKSFEDGVARGQRFNGFMRGYSTHVCDSTQKAQEWAWGNLRDYAVNRKNKGLIRYTLGITSRFTMGSLLSATNFATHFIRSCKELFSANSNVTEKDLGISPSDKDKLTEE